MSLAVLGFDGMVQPAVKQLKQALVSLQGQPPGAPDPSMHLDAEALTALLNLDPFVAGGPAALLLPPRFVDISHGALEIGGGVQTYNASHTITTTDVSSTVNTTTKVENDSAGLLGFLGIGVTDAQTLQSQVSQSSSAQSSVGETFSQEYILNGDRNGFYACEVYFDVTFGAFAFRDVSAINAEPAVSGVMQDQNGKPLSDVPIRVAAGNRTFLTKSDSAGQFKLFLPGIQSAHLNLSAQGEDAQIEYRAAPIKDLR